MQYTQFSVGNKRQVENTDVPTCPVCMEKLGTYGGPSSLACGHSGCLDCLQQVQTHNAIPVCPLCRTPFDAELKLGPNINLRDALLRLELTSLESFRSMEGDPAKYALSDCQRRQFLLESSRSFDQHNAEPNEEISSWTPVLPPPKDIMDGSTHVINAFPCDVRGEGENNSSSKLGDSQFEANLWSVVRGILATLSGRGRSTAQEVCSPHSRFHEGPDGDARQGFRDVWASVHLPSAPPLLSTTEEGDDSALRATLGAEPPQWVPDSASSNCLQCRAKFLPLTRGRHHCRFCGQIFCGPCSAGKCLLPIKFMEREPQRVCDVCYERLEPIQHLLTNHISNAAQIAIHDVTDFTCMRYWLNNPLGLSMQEEIYKATNILRGFGKIGRLKSEKSIPEAVLQGAKGLAILTVVKVGFVITYKVGTGLVVARRDDGSWSAPSAIASCGLGWGPQVGGELVDFVIVLPTVKAVKAFSGCAHVSIGAGLSAAVGPLGRLAEADVRVGDGGATACYTYSCSQGAFLGLSFEGNLVRARVNINARFYGDPYLSPEDMLFGSVPMPRAAAPLYGALHDVFARVECPQQSYLASVK